MTLFCFRSRQVGTFFSHSLLQKVLLTLFMINVEQGFFLVAPCNFSLVCATRSAHWMCYRKPGTPFIRFDSESPSFLLDFFFNLKVLKLSSINVFEFKKLHLELFLSKLSLSSWNYLVNSLYPSCTIEFLRFSWLMQKWLLNQASRPPVSCMWGLGNGEYF